MRDMFWCFGRLKSILTPLMLGGCAVRLIAPYDAPTEQGASGILSDWSKHYQDMVYKYPTGAGCQYADNVSFYKAMYASLANLRVRVGAIGRNAQTQGQVEAVQAIIQDEEKLQIHKRDVAANSGSSEKCLSPDELSPDNRAVEQAVGAVLKLEVAKGKSQ